MNELTIHFLNVGHGDCTVIRHPSGRITVIDTSNGEEIDDSIIEAQLRRNDAIRLQYTIYRALGRSKREALRTAGVDLPLTNPVSFIRENYPGQSIFRYIQTHPEMDHMRGISALDSQIGFTNFWDTNNSRICKPETHDEEDWAAYQRLRQNARKYTRSDMYAYFAREESGSPGGDQIEILSPSATLTAECDEGSDWNNMSFVLRVTHAGVGVIFGGDAGERAWTNIVDCYGKNLKSTVLKASHHGRKSGYHKPAIDLIDPTIVVLSIADECEHEALEEYRRHSKYVWSTYECGNITLTVTAEGKITYSFQNVGALA